MKGLGSNNDPKWLIIKKKLKPELEKRNVTYWIHSLLKHNCNLKKYIPDDYKFLIAKHAIVNF